MCGTKSIRSALARNYKYIRVYKKLREQKNRETFTTIIPVESLKRVR